jgi:diaminopimelate epimerase
VIFTDVLPGDRLAEYGTMVSAQFTDGINVEFACLENRTELSLQVWERGSGATLACGTGASAVAYAAYLQNLGDTHLFIHLPGGDVRTDYHITDNHLFLTSSVRKVFEGIWQKQI